MTHALQGLRMMYRLATTHLPYTPVDQREEYAQFYSDSCQMPGLLFKLQLFITF
jgi:hypothetical protein